MADFDALLPVRTTALNFTTEVANAVGTTINPAEDYTPGSTTSGQNGVLTQGATTTAAPTYTTGTTNPLSLTTAGALRTDASATTQPISGSVSISGTPTVTVGNASIAVTGTFWQATQPVSLSSTTITGTVAVTESGTWNITNISGTVSLPTGASTSALQTTGNTSLSTIAGAILTQGTTTTGQTGNLILGAVTTAAPTYTTGTINALSLDTSGNLRVTLAAGTIAVTQSTSPWVVSLASTTITGSVAVTGTFWQATQPISGSVSISNFPVSQAVTGTFWQATQPVSLAGTVAENLTQVGGSALALGQTTMASSIPVVFASNQTPLNVNIGGGVTPVFTYATTAAVASLATATQTVAGPINLDAVHVTASGEVKVVIAIGVTGSETTKWVGFTSAANKNFDWILADTLAIPSGSDVKITITNEDKSAMDIYSSVASH
jgi:hypothetical protein